MEAYDSMQFYNISLFLESFFNPWITVHFANRVIWQLA